LRKEDIVVIPDCEKKKEKDKESHGEVAKKTYLNCESEQGVGFSQYQKKKKNQHRKNLEKRQLKRADCG